MTDVSWSYGGLLVLEKVSIKLDAGTVVGLIGDNGAGKTTLMRVAAGILGPQAGRVRVFGFDPNRERKETLLRVGGMMETPGHYDELSVRANLAHWYGFYQSPRVGSTADEVEEALSRFGLAGQADQRAGSLSEGFRRRLGVARAVHPKADLVLLDEPLEGLDPRARNDLKDQIRRLGASGRTVFLSSHHLADIDALCQTVWVIASRRVHRFSGFDEVRSLVGSESAQDLDAVYARLAARLESEEGGRWAT
jgi:ABC-2 type transport system ATP-binding protein